VSLNQPAILPRAEAQHLSQLIWPKSGGQHSGQRFPALRAQWRDCSPVGFLSRLITEHRHHQTAAQDLTKAVATRAELMRLAEDRDWSQRRLAKEAGLSWGTWRRFPENVGNLSGLLPKLELALCRLTTNNN
jgi:hypothetical protein